MKIAVWDTYVARRDGRLMHFDIIAPCEVKEIEKILSFGKEYLQSKGEAEQSLSAQECEFCHMEEANPEIVASIQTQGYYIVEMENC